MAKQIKQFRFYSDEDERNYPEIITTSTNLASGEVFAKYMPVSQLSIQALPGTKFYLNNSNSPIIIGYTGIYELSVNNLAEITSLKFDYESIMRLNTNKETVLLVDIIYDKEEG